MQCVQEQSFFILIYLNFEDYLTRSAYVFFDDSMLTQSLLVDHSQSIIVLLDYHHIGNNTNPVQYDCSRNCPRTIYRGLTSIK